MQDLLVSWPAQVVDRLSRLLAGHPRSEFYFNAAWAKALKDCPPRGRDLLTPEQMDGQLFGTSGRKEQDETLVEAMKRFCLAAWLGEQPGLAKFSPELLADLDLMDRGHELEDRPVAA